MTACTAAPGDAPLRTPVACDGETAVDTRLHFGLSRADGAVVTAADWSGFVDRVVAPAFSSGFTILTADGYWRDPETGRAVREASRVVVRIHPGDDASEHAIENIIAAYKRALEPQSVQIGRASCRERVCQYV